MIKKYFSVMLCIIMTLSCVLLPSQAYAALSLATTQEAVPGVSWTDSLRPYVEFNSKLADGAFYIPGLNSTVSEDKDFKHYAANDSMIPQAMCSVDQFTLITAYDGDSSARSVIYVLDYNKNLVKTLVLPDSYHVGGIAYDSNNRVILVTKASKCTLAVISLEDFYRYLTFNSPFVKISYTVADSSADAVGPSFSGVTYRNGKVYVSSFGSGSSSVAYCYTPSYNAAAKTYSLTYQYKFSLPNYTQGITVSSYKEKLRLFVSVSYGRSEKKNIYCSYLYTYTFDENTGEKTFDNILTCPPMLQQTYCKGGKIYCLFESAAKLYRSENKDPLDVVIPLKLSKICDEKQGNNINVNVKNVANGKSISVSTNIQGAKIYYSSSMPYIRQKSVKNAYTYKSAYTKTASSMVYAVAVADGRIVASDAVYVTVSKAKAPTKLRVTAKSSKAVNLAWNKASGASGYYIYRSTSKNGKYALVGTVSGNKTKYKDRTVKKNKTYYYKIKAYKKGCANSSYTSSVSVKTKKS